MPPSLPQTLLLPQCYSLFTSGFAYKRPFEAFLRQYWQLLPSVRDALRHLLPATASPSHATASSPVAITPRSPPVCRGGVALAPSPSHPAAACPLSSSLREAARQLLQSAGGVDFHLGKTKVGGSVSCWVTNGGGLVGQLVGRLAGRSVGVFPMNGRG